jgi:hypothetical protein
MEVIGGLPTHVSRLDPDIRALHASSGGTFREHSPLGDAGQIAQKDFYL